jgi:hypothetical protein
VLGRTQRLKLLTGLGMAACLMLTTMAPSYAQSAPSMGSAWTAGPGAVGSSTYVGRVETPRPRQNINPNASLLVTGWAADTTAQGWSGIDGMEVWSGAQNSGGTKVATGSVGLARPDVAEALGSGFTNSGFSAVVPSSVWSNLTPGGITLNVYIHTPNKGSWSRTVGLTLLQAPVLPYPNDPVIYIAKPQEGMNITQRQLNNKVTFSGVAIDRNPLSAVSNSLSLLPPGIGQTLGTGCPACAGATGAIATQNRNAGVNSITAYVDTPPKPGDNTQFGNFGTACASCTQGVSILVSGKGVLNVAGRPQASIISDSFGNDVSGNPMQFRFGGWSISINPALLSGGPHTLFVTATSSITGKSTTTKVGLNILPFTNPSQRIQP